MDNVFLSALDQRDNPNKKNEEVKGKNVQNTKTSPPPSKGGNVFLDAIGDRDKQNNLNLFSSIGQSAVKAGVQATIPKSRNPFIYDPAPEQLNGPTIENAKRFPVSIPPSSPPPETTPSPTETIPPPPPTNTPPIPTIPDFAKVGLPPASFDGSTPRVDQKRLDTPLTSQEIEKAKNSTNDLTLPELNFGGKGGVTGHVVEKLVNVPIQTFLHSANELSNSTYTLTNPLTSKTEKTGAALRAIPAAVNVIPSWLLTSSVIEAAKELPINLKNTGKYFAPINPIIAAASQIPGAEKIDLNPAKALSKGFEILGKGGVYAVDKGLDIAPIPEESKEIIREPLEQIGALLAQVVAAHYGFKYGGELIGKAKEQMNVMNDTMIEKVKTAQENGQKITPEVARKIVAETKNEIAQKISLEKESSLSPEKTTPSTEQSLTKPKEISGDISKESISTPENLPSTNPPLKNKISTTPEPQTSIIENKGQNIPPESVQNPPTNEIPTSNIKTSLREAQVAKTPIPERIQPLEGNDFSGETKVSGLSRGVEAKALEHKLTEGFGDLPEYKTMNIAEQAQKATELLTKDYEQAKRVAMGHEAPPEGIHPESVFVALEEKAIKEGDVNTLRDLATNSKLTSEATEMGQRIRLLAERDPESPIGAIEKVGKAREESFQKKNANLREKLRGKKVDIKVEKEKIASEIKKEIKKSAPTKQDWISFVESIKC